MYRLEAEYRHACRRAEYPHQVAFTPREDRGQYERTGKLDSHRQPERDARQRIVEESVHEPERDTKNEHGTPLAGRPA